MQWSNNKKKSSPEIKLFFQTASRRKTSKRILKLHGGLTLSQLSSWAFHFVSSRVCLSDLRGHVHVMGGLCVGLLMLTTIWLYLQSNPTKKANTAHQGGLIASRVKGLVELKDPSQPESRIINGLAFHRRCCFLIFSLSVGCSEKGSKTCFWLPSVLNRYQWDFPVSLVENVDVK